MLVTVVVRFAGPTVLVREILSCLDTYFHIFHLNSYKPYLDIFTRFINLYKSYSHTSIYDIFNIGEPEIVNIYVSLEKDEKIPWSYHPPNYDYRSSWPRDPDSRSDRFWSGSLSACRYS